MNWWGSGLITIINYGSSSGSEQERFYLLTESGLFILTESGIPLMV